jgi:ATP/maltotriose-dependent transcriptional regulator MalT/DNA-binding SARP family transcriptional activator
LSTSRTSPELFSKIVPAAAAPFVIERPRVRGYLSAVAQRRLTVLSAGAGYGKTTALASWSVGAHCAWYRLTKDDRDPLTMARGLLASLGLRVPGLAPLLGTSPVGVRGPDARGADLVDAVVPTLAGVLQHELVSETVLILDDVDEVSDSPDGVRFVGSFCHMAPRRLHLVLAMRADLPFRAHRLRMSGQLHTLTAQSLGFDEDETAALLERVGGTGLAVHAPVVRRLTAGWPAATRLVAETLATSIDPSAALAAITGSGGAADLVGDLLDSELADASREVVALLRVGAAIDEFNADLLAVLGVPDAEHALAIVRRRGIHVEHAPRDGWFELSPLAREYGRLRLLTSDDELELHGRAAAWFRDQGEADRALSHLLAAGDVAAAAALLAEEGEGLLAAGGTQLVRRALAELPPDLRTPAIDLLEGEACYTNGDWDRASACLERLVDPSGGVPAAAAWRLGLIAHLRGEPERALSLYRLGLSDDDGTPHERALSAAWGAAAAWLTGDVRSCRELAEAAIRLVEPARDARALAAAHTALAMLAALDGDRRGNDMHYLRALDYARQAGDTMQEMRIRTNRGSRFLEEGYCAEAVAELDTAITLADLAGFAAIRALALQNRGEASRRLGRLEDAARDLHAALSEYQRIDSRLAAYALAGLGAVHEDQGSPSLARAAFEEAAAIARPTGDLQGLVPALCGLARALAAEDLQAARALAAEVVGSPPNLAQAQAHLTAGWLALRAADVQVAAQHASEATRLARSRRDRAAIAEAIELQAAITTGAEERMDLLQEAEAMWEALGSPVPLARTQLALIADGGPEAAHRSLHEIERGCVECGARSLATQAARAQADQPATVTEIAIHTLGGFLVQRAGMPVPLVAWQSRKARDLLKLLVSRLGTPAPRELLYETLWPDADPARASARLSVAISTLRSVLDPEHHVPADRYVVSEDGVVSLRPDHIDIDVNTFLRLADVALTTDASRLEAAEAAYAGDFCVEDQYADWAQPLRERARAAYVAVARALAQRHCAAREHEAAVRYLLRVLASEPYDEPASLSLVRNLDAVGRHGDARRMYRTYIDRMRGLDIEPAPYPGPSDPDGFQATSGPSR